MTKQDATTDPAAEEATEETAEYDKGPILDLVIVAGMQRIEHYGIAAYGIDVVLAEALGEMDVAALLKETLAEEKATDLKLTEVTQASLMSAAMGASPPSPKPKPRSRAA